MPTESQYLTMFLNEVRYRLCVESKLYSNNKLLVMYPPMSEFAFFRFRSNNMLTKEEEEHKEEIVQLTEDVLQAKGIQCDASISKIPEEELKEILEKVRELRRKKKKQSGTEIINEEEAYLRNR